jgi:hypothetical protein
MKGEEEERGEQINTEIKKDEEVLSEGLSALKLQKI